MSSSLEIALEKVLPELVQRMDALQTAQNREIGEIRRSLDTWGGVTQQLTELLTAKTRETEGVAASYAQLAEHLMKFVIHLSAAETFMHAVSEQLKHSSPSDRSSASTLAETQQLLADMKASHEQLRESLHQISTQQYPQKSSLESPSIWTELFAWRPAIAWFSIGGMGVAVFLLLTLRMSGFNLAVRSLLSVDARLQRIEQFIGLTNVPEVPDEAAPTADPTFEEQPFPDE